MTEQLINIGPGVSLPRVNTSDRLAPCPFCSSTPVMRHDTRSEHRVYWHWYVECSDCGAMGPSAETEGTAAFFWNDRN